MTAELRGAATELPHGVRRRRRVDLDAGEQADRPASGRRGPRRSRPRAPGPSADSDETRMAFSNVCCTYGTIARARATSAASVSSARFGRCSRRLRANVLVGVEFGQRIGRHRPSHRGRQLAPRGPASRATAGARRAAPRRARRRTPCRSSPARHRACGRRVPGSCDSGLYGYPPKTLNSSGSSGSTNSS